jgi:hypothetical protein
VEDELCRGLISLTTPRTAVAAREVGTNDSGGGKVVSVKKARLVVKGVGNMTKTINPGAAMSVFGMDTVREICRRELK